jgi:malonyl-CoA decarboxylase
MTDVATESFIDRAMGNVRNAWRDIAVRARLGSDKVRPDLPKADAALLTERIEECLEGRGGEVSARARAADLGRLYLSLSPAGRQRFLKILAQDFGVVRGAVEDAMAAYREAGDDDPAALGRAEDRLREALVSRRARLLTQLTTLPEGFKFLVDLRAELLGLLDSDRALAGLEHDMRRLLASWFDVGFLTLTRITWDSPASLLEKLVAYEAVHEIRSWDDLKNRLGADRRCYAFFHPRMPSEPLIFIQVALVNGLAGNVQTLLDESAPEGDPTAADTAIFYSISNAQKGLRNISMGNFLIKQVVDDLSHELPNLKTFATLSPIPGFRTWLDHRLAEGEPNLLTAAEHERLRAVMPGHGAKGSLKALLDSPGWHRDDKAAAALEKPLTRLCARYLVNEKHKDRPLDPVARFHLSNGARVERINWRADTTAKGLSQSAGLMVNYLYRLRDIEKNVEAFTGENKVASSPAVRSLIGG